MQLDVIIESRNHPLEVPAEVLETGLGFFDKMDRDMDAGWQVGPEFVERPDRMLRARIVAERLMLAVEQGNETMVQGMAGYILSRVPEARTVRVNTDGEPQLTEFLDAAGRPTARRSACWRCCSRFPRRPRNFS